MTVSLRGCACFELASSRSDGWTSRAVVGAMWRQVQRQRRRPAYKKCLAAWLNGRIPTSTSLPALAAQKLVLFLYITTNLFAMFKVILAVALAAVAVNAAPSAANFAGDGR